MAASGTRFAIEITTMSATIAVIRSMRAMRDGDTISSSRTSSIAFMVNDRHRGRADPHQLVRRMLERDPDRKSLGDAHPVELALARRHTGDGEVLRLRHCRGDALHDALQADLRRD